MAASAVKHLLALSLCLLFCAELAAKDEFAALDERIVQAYNAQPKKTAEVYSLCLEMLDLAGDSGKDGKSAAWSLKAKKLLTLACLNEAMEAQKRNDFKQVYVWCGRGIAQGSSQGEIGGLDLAQVAELLENLQGNAKKSMDASGESYSNLSMQFRPPSRTDARTAATPDFFEEPSAKPAASSSSSGVAGSIAPVDVKGAGLGNSSSTLQGRLRSGADKGIAILEGPRQDRERNLFVRVETPAGKELKIIYVKGKGWADSSLSAPIYFDTWMACAEDAIRNESK